MLLLENYVVNYMKEIFIGLFCVSSIVAILQFLIRQSIWTRYISPVVSRKSKPIITFENGTDVMSVSISTFFDIEDEVKKQLNKEIQLLPEAHIQNPYDNPWALLMQLPENYPSSG